MAGPLVRLVDDDPDLLAAQVQALRLAGFTPEPFSAAEPALAGLGPDYPGVVLSDVRMPGMDGFAYFSRIQALDPDLPVILLTGHGDVPMAVAALKGGVWDFLTKPVGVDALTAALRRAGAARHLVLENRRLLQASRLTAGQPPERPRLAGDSAVMVHLRGSLARVAETGVDALIAGPEGAGKEIAARVIHDHSSRRARGFVQVSCAALDPARFEIEFLGAEAGHPAAPRHARLVGRLEKAHRGTLFLCEVEALPLSVQARLLAVLEAGELTALGAIAPRALDLRVLAGTRVDLAAEVAAGRFRADLYYRLSGITLQMPPLIARREDIAPLFRQFLIEACARLDLPVPGLTALVLARLQAHDWPGNLRELRQFAEKTALGLPALPGGPTMADQPGFTELIAGYEAEILRESLRDAGGNASRAMALLKLPRKTFYDKLARHNIRPGDFRLR